MDWDPTHELTWTPFDGGSGQRWLVALRRERFARGFLVAVTRLGTADWSYSEATRIWRWRGLSGPGGRDGRLRVRELALAPRLVEDHEACLASA